MKIFAVGCVVVWAAVSVAACAQVVSAGASGSQSGGAVVTFTYEREGLPVPKFSLTLGEDGRGRYAAVVAPQGADVTGQTVDREMTVSAKRTAEVFRVARELKEFNFACASAMKGIAKTGAKTLAYAGADGAGRCAFDYTEDKRVAALTSEFLAIAWTMDEGRKLEFEHRFDRLGLDAEIVRFANELKAGRAVEVGNIAPALRAIAGDGQVIERVRAKAAEILVSGL